MTRNTPRFRRAYRVTGAAIMLSAISFFLVYAVQHVKDTPPLSWGAASAAVAIASVGLVMMSIGIVTRIWMLLLRDAGVAASEGRRR